MTAAVPAATSAQATAPIDDIDALAQGLAAADPAEVDRVTAAEVARAVRDHRLADAIRWQRVRLRARSIRHRRLAAAG